MLAILAPSHRRILPDDELEQLAADPHESAQRRLLAQASIALRRGSPTPHAADRLGFDIAAELGRSHSEGVSRD